MSELVPLSSLATANPPVPGFPRTNDTVVTFAPLECIWPSGRADFSRREVGAKVASGYTQFQRGDVLLPKITPTFEAGRTCVADIDTHFGAGTTELHVLRPKRGSDPRFIAYVCRSEPFLQDGATRLQGVGNLRRVPEQFVEQFKIPATISGLAEQRAIADFLDRETARIDTLIAKQEALIETLRERRFAAISHGVQAGPLTPFRRAVRTVRQGWSPNCEPWPTDGVTEWAVLKTGCSNTGRFNPTENKRLPDGTSPRPEFAVRQGEIVMSRSNTKELVGAAAVVDGHYPRLLLSDLTYGITLSEHAEPEFVAYALSGSHARSQIGSASKGTSPSMQKISQRDIAGLLLALPTMEDQRKIVRLLNEQAGKIDTMIEKAARFIELSKERRSALITAAVTGQIDVRGAA